MTSKNINVWNYLQYFYSIFRQISSGTCTVLTQPTAGGRIGLHIPLHSALFRTFAKFGGCTNWPNLQTVKKHGQVCKYHPGFRNFTVFSGVFQETFNFQKMKLSFLIFLSEFVNNSC